jgi:hypothetical protein
VRGRAGRAALASLERTADVFRALGYARGAKEGAFAFHLDPPEGARPLVARMAVGGRIFGGSFALELSTAEPVLPPSGGLRARGRGVVRLQGVQFRPKGADAAGAELAAGLEADEPLQSALAAVHFERIRVEPDGTPVIRHMGGSVVWMLFPPLVRPVPLTVEQARATVRALEAFPRG